MNSVLEELIEAMNDRYNHYQTLYDHYEDAITLDKQLFEMLKDEELTMEILQEQIDEVNEAYEKVSDSKQQFNESTDAYNELKREFYSKAELNVQFD
ncbi:hypothetical protein JCM9140_4213 [Halalkalibacter wakoensis JCM 9140]|uniref:Uncharacterized protein n=1 Tax=Halalkalibacter wakoensis JCM 9140 TaxID=1236970 RepID=W4Q7R2_9BACI|nr:hypothetical protein JCM9140_4213 [Halalkalibacter wakoensis JCM 9140]